MRRDIDASTDPPRSGHAVRTGASSLLVNSFRAPAARMPAVERTSPPAGTPTASMRSPTGIGSGFAKPRAPRGRQLTLQVLDLPVLTLVLASQAIDLVLLPGALPPPAAITPPEVPRPHRAGVPYPLVIGIVAGRPVLVDHTRLMPYSRQGQSRQLALVWPPAKPRQRQGSVPHYANFSQLLPRWDKRNVLALTRFCVAENFVPVHDIHEVAAIFRFVFLGFILAPRTWERQHTRDTLK